jgi:tetratricopeptide (TPR) repeat protein
LALTRSAEKPRTPTHTTGPARVTRNWRVGLRALALLIVTLAVYSPAWHGGLVWDDEMHITASALRSWAGLSRIWLDVRATLQYYPVLHSAFWIEHRLWGDATLGYHLANILQHVGAALLLALVLRRLSVPGAWVAAAIFALHPIQTESVAWISEQKNTLSAVFYLSAILAYLRFDETRKARWYATSLAVFGLALLSKTVTATLPGALLVVFWWRRGRLSWTRDVLPLLPFFVAAAAAATMTAWFEIAVNKSVGADFHLTAVERVLVAGRGIWFHLAKLSWPAGLSFMYPRWAIDPGAWWQYLFPLGVVALAAGLWAIRGWSRAPLGAFLYFCGTLFPVLGFASLYTHRYAFVANHYQYLACIGPIALVAALLTKAAGRIPSPAARGLVIAAPLVLLAGVSHADAAKFASSETLLQDTIAKDPRSWFAYTNLGSLRLSQGRSAEARACFEQVLGLKPDFAVAYNNLGNTWLREGDLEQATRNHRRAVALQPDYAEAHNNLGIDLARAGRYDEAIASYRRAIALDPRYALAHYNLANALVRIRDATGAERHYRESIALDPDSALPHYALGLELLSQRRRDEAGEELRTAFRLKPDFAQGYYELGNMQLQQEQVADAIASYSNALRVRPAYAEAHCNLGVALMRQGRVAEAVAEYEQAIRLKADYAIAHNNLGFALEQEGRDPEAAAHYAEALRIDPSDARAAENLARLRASSARGQSRKDPAGRAPAGPQLREP